MSENEGAKLGAIIFFLLIILLGIAGDIDHSNIVGIGAFGIACLVGWAFNQRQK